MKNQIGLATDYVSEIAKKLNVVLSDVQVFYMNVRGFHWNITGKQFFLLHGKFEELYNSLNEMADELAERILVLEEKPWHAFSKYLEMSTIAEVEGASTPDKTVQEILKGLKTLLGKEREIALLAAEAGDDGTVNLVSSYIDEQEKLIWMYAAFLKDL